MLLLATPQSAIANDILIVSNTKNASLTLDKREVRDIFLGRVASTALKPVVLTPGQTARTVFNIRVVGLSESRIQSYWAQMRFSGRNNPPREFATVDALLEHIVSTPGTIGYVPADTVVPDELVVVFSTGE